MLHNESQHTHCNQAVSEKISFDSSEIIGLCSRKTHQKILYVCEKIKYSNGRNEIQNIWQILKQ